MESMITLALITFACGCVGGYGGYLIERVKLLNSETAFGANSYEDRLYQKLSFVLGIVAAFTVPAFLQLASLGSESKTLVDGILENQMGKPVFVYVGFCLLAAVSGQSFVTKLSSKIIDELVADAKSAKKQAQQAQKKSQEAEEEIEDLKEDLETIQINNVTGQINPESLEVLKVIQNHDKRRVNLEDLSREISMDTTKLQRSLSELEKSYMLAGKVVDGDVTWRTRSAGRAALKKSNMSESQ